MGGFITIAVFIFTLFIGFGIYEHKTSIVRTSFDWEMVWPSFFFSVFIGLVTTIIISTIDQPDDVYTQTRNTEIHSLYNDSNISGNFFILAGSFEGKKYYVYLIKNKHGNYVKKRIEEEYDGTVEIKTYKNNKTPVIKKQYRIEKNNGFWSWNYAVEDLQRTIIQIPEGSLKTNIQIK